MSSCAKIFKLILQSPSFLFWEYRKNIKNWDKLVWASNADLENFLQFHLHLLNALKIHILRFLSVKLMDKRAVDVRDRLYHVWHNTPSPFAALSFSDSRHIPIFYYLFDKENSNRWLVKPGFEAATFCITSAQSRHSTKCVNNFPNAHHFVSRIGYVHVSRPTNYLTLFMKKCV